MSESRVWRFGEPVAPLAGLLARGGFLAVPTESSYGLAADPRDEAGVAAIYRVKGRARRKPLPVVVADLDQIRALGGEPEAAERLGLTAAWPAALSVVMPLREPLAASAGRPSLAFRVPAHSRLRELLRDLGHGLTATSANRSGGPPILDTAELHPLLVRSDAWIVDGGRLPGGAPSTLVEVGETGVRILRQGAYLLDPSIPAAGGDEAPA